MSGIAAKVTVSFRLLRPVFPSRVRQLAGVGLALALPAAPAWAALPEAFASPVVTICTGLAAMLGTGGGIYLMLLRRRFAACEAELAALRAGRWCSPLRGAARAAAGGGHQPAFPAGGGGRPESRRLVDREGRFFASQVIERYTGRSAAEVLADFVDLVVYERDRSYCRTRSVGRWPTSRSASSNSGSSAAIAACSGSAVTGSRSATARVCSSGCGSR